MTKKYHIRPAEQPVGDFRLDYRAELNPEQYDVVTNGDGACLVLAGAGSGKTRTLVYRVAYLLERGVPAERIALMTFTNRAAKEMLSRIESLLGSKPEGLWGGTFHYIGNRLLRMYGKQIGLDPSFTILDAEDSVDLVNVCIHELAPQRDKYFPKASVVRQMISLSANLLQPITSIITERYSYIEPQLVPTLSAIAASYDRKKRLANTLDYDDLLVWWHRLLTENDELRQRLSSRFQYILVDEYQDTNPLQAAVVKAMTSGVGNVLVVGDDAQSIYSFRGATVQNILRFPKDFSEHKVFRLDINYRSVPDILALANASISQNQNQFPKHLQATKPAGQKPVVMSVYDASQQADFVCQRMLELQTEEGIELSHMAVLFRAHFQSLELELELNKRGIPYDLRGGVRFFEQAHIKDVVAHLKAFQNTQDELAWLRVLRLQSGVGDALARRIWEQLPPEVAAIIDTWQPTVPPKALAGWRQVVKVWQLVATVATQPVGASIERILASGYNEYVKANFDNASDRLEDLKQLVDFANRYTALGSFLDDIALSEGFKGQSVTGYEESPGEAVTLSTVHQAKGLEWKVVFVIGLIDGQMPHAKAASDPAQLEEERRLFYVAVTRAEEQLYLVYPLVTSRGDLFAQPSPFIQELPTDVYERWESDQKVTTTDDDTPWSDDDDASPSILDMYLRQHRS